MHKLTQKLWKCHKCIEDIARKSYFSKFLCCFLTSIDSLGLYSKQQA